MTDLRLNSEKIKMKNNTKTYVIPGVCLPVGFQPEQGNLVLRTSIGCEICAILRGEPIVAYEANPKDEGQYKQESIRDYIAKIVKSESFSFPSLSENASFEQFSKHSTNYNTAYNDWERKNLTLEVVEDKLRASGELNFRRLNFLGVYPLLPGD